MPTYEYKCDTCGIHFERWQRMTDEPVKTCPECEGPVHRVLHPVGIVFKGSGWYCTDHRSGSATLAPKDKAEDKPEAKSESKDKAESKPEAKSEAKAEKKDG